MTAKSVEVVDDQMLERSCLCVLHHVLKFRPVGEQRAAHAIILVNLPLRERPPFRRDERSCSVNLARDRLLFLGDVVLLIALAGVDGRNHGRFSSGLTRLSAFAARSTAASSCAASSACSPVRWRTRPARSTAVWSAFAASSIAALMSSSLIAQPPWAQPARR